MTTKPNIKNIAGAILTESYNSGELSISSSTQQVLVHGLSTEPKIIIGDLVCKVAEYGYSVGDKIPVPLQYMADYAQGRGVNCIIENATEIKLRFGVNGFPIFRKDTYGSGLAGSATNWRLVVRAYA